ncbi:META domain-containing protein [Streptomyces sp. MUM 203J]|uniref:META domain-containing protein n=1 Tax=Streptomyces sp. MUM 203J TaxID=2791990 RepID=UPI001F03C443|nr:META domain-containing protein [Streptomyces sp. MUM 203J]MCH0542138.1 META domain-containing protein [Streptomyces sp. MUM 203J]
MRIPKRNTAAVLLTLLVLSGLGACGAGAGGGGEPAPLPLTHTRWTVDRVVVGGAGTVAPDRTDAHVRFTRSRAEGFLGCNRFGADAGLRGDRITLGEPSMTERACAGAVQRFEDLLSSLLTGGPLRAELDGSRLTLTTVDGDTVALSERPAAALLGTTWTVDGLLTGGGASTLPVGTDGPARLTLGPDGSAHGGLGCNTFTAAVTVRPDTLTFGPVATTRKLCDRPGGELEEHLLAVLRGGPLTYRVGNDTLTVTAGDGTGFTARAAEAAAPSASPSPPGCAHCAAPPNGGTAPDPGSRPDGALPRAPGRGDNPSVTA